MYKLVILISSLFIFSKTAITSEFSCDNIFDLNICKMIGKGNDLFNQCPSNMMKKKFKMIVNTGNITSSIKHHKDKERILKTNDKENLYKSFNKNEIYFLPNKGYIITVFWDGDIINKELVTNFHNYLNYDDLKGTYISTFISQNDDIELNGDIEFYSKFGDISFDIKIKKKSDPANTYLYTIKGFCEIIGNNPLSSPSNKKDALKLFK